MLCRVLVITSFITLALGKPLRRDLQLHESRQNPPSGFVLTGPAALDATLTLRLALVQNDTMGMIEALYDVSTPSSANYGQHLSKEEVESFVAPKAESVQAVNAWLADNNLSAVAITPAGDWMSVKVPISHANDLLGTEFSVYTHNVTGKQVVRTLSYSIPTGLVGHLDLVHPTVAFTDPYGHTPLNSYATRPNNSLESSSSPENCLVDGYLMTPACLQSLYRIPTGPANSSLTRLAVPGYVAERAEYSDLRQFLEEHRPDMNPNTTFSVVSLSGGVDPQNNTGTNEASLDIEYTVGLATDVPVTFIAVGGGVETGDDFANLLVDTASYMLNLTSPPQTMTTSYGVDEDNVSEKLALNLCNMYAQLGARGVSVIFGSGDGGVSGIQYQTCTTFSPTFPSGCPYLTSVGGTVGIPEVAANFSGGGFSNYFPRAAFQASAVSRYLESSGSANEGLYNASGRGYPDVAAYADNVDIIVQGSEFPIWGTSCASPTFTSVITLLNDELLSVGRPTLGWLNPFLYSTGKSALNDITEGNNYACSGNTTGFNTAVGWDPVTGLGTPDYIRLRAAIGL